MQCAYFSSKKLNNRHFGKNIVFERSQLMPRRRLILMNTLELIIKEKKINIGNTLKVELPCCMNLTVIEDLKKYSQQAKFSTPSRIILEVLNSIYKTTVLSTSENLEKESALVNMDIYAFTIYVYSNMQTQYRRKKVSGKEASKLTLSEFLTKSFADLAQVCCDENTVCYDKFLNKVSLDSPFSSVPVLHVFPDWNAFQDNLLTVLENLGWMLPLEVPDDLLFSKQKKRSIEDVFLVEPEFIISFLNDLNEPRVANDNTMIVTQKKLLQACESQFQNDQKDEENLIFTFLKNYEFIHLYRLANHSICFLPIFLFGKSQSKVFPLFSFTFSILFFSLTRSCSKNQLILHQLLKPS